MSKPKVFRRIIIILILTIVIIVLIACSILGIGIMIQKRKNKYYNKKADELNSDINALDYIVENRKKIINGIKEDVQENDDNIDSWSINEFEQFHNSR